MITAFVSSSRVQTWITPILIAASLNRLSSLATANEAAPPVTSGVICLDAQPPETGRFDDERGWLLGDLLCRELVRQAVLIAVRDEVGLATRDAALREPFPEPSERAALINIITQTRHGRGVWFRLTHNGEPVLELEQECLIGPINQYVEMATVMERLSRETLPEPIRQLGLPSRSRPGPNHEDVAEETRRQLALLNLLDQFDVVRACHAEIAQLGESPQRLGVLVRAYANLGQLSQPFLSSMHRTFRARSLLYAERMIAAHPDSPVGLWHRAYALSLAGLQRWSIEDLKAAETLTSDGTEVPDWITLLHNFNNYRFRALVKAATAADELSQLAGLLLFVSVETSKSQPLILDTGLSVTKLNPFDLRTLDGMFREAGVGYNHMLTELAPQHLASLLEKKLPELRCLVREDLEALEGVFRRSESMVGRTEIAAALARRTTAQATEEPSLATLGRLIEEQNVLQFFRRAVFMRDHWSVDTDDYVAENHAAYALHPYAAALACMAFEYQSRPEQYQQRLHEQVVGDTNLASMIKLIARVPKSVSFANMTQPEAWQRLYAQRTGLEFEYYLHISTKIRREDRVRHAKWMFDASPHSPYRIHVLIKEDWEGSRETMLKEKWEERYGDHPLVAKAFGDHYYDESDWETAGTYYRRQIESAPSVAGHVGLAKVLWKQEDDAWLTTLELALGLEDYGLNHADVNNRIAATLMEQGKYDEALPYAEEAASSYSGWSLECLAFCHEGLAQWEQAESVVLAAARRYGNGSWYYWCVRTGKGDIVKAWSEWRNHLGAYYGEDSPVLKRLEVNHHIFTGDKQAAYAMSTKHADALPHSNNSLVRALLADELGHHDKAKAVLQKMADDDDDAYQGYAIMYLELMAAQTVTEESIERLLAEHDVGRGTVMSYLGWHLANRGEASLARKYLRGISGSRRWNASDVLYAQFKLRELGVEISDYPRRYPRSCDAD